MIPAAAIPAFAPTSCAPLAWEPFSQDVAKALARELSPRRTGEAIGIYETRVERNTSLLIEAGLEPGNPLHRYLTRLQPFTSAADRPHALKHAAREALQRRAA